MQGDPCVGTEGTPRVLLILHQTQIVLKAVSAATLAAPRGPRSSGFYTIVKCCSRHEVLVPKTVNEQ